jgi:hypothetical protein
MTIPLPWLMTDQEDNVVRPYPAAVTPPPWRSTTVTTLLGQAAPPAAGDTSDEPAGTTLGQVGVRMRMALSGAQIRRSRYYDVA